MSWQHLTRRAQQDDGQDLLEYGMLGALIAVVVLVGVRAFGGLLKTGFWDVVADLL